MSQKVLVLGIFGILAGAIALSLGQFGATPDPEEFRIEHGLVDQAELEGARSRERADSDKQVSRRSWNARGHVRLGSVFVVCHRGKAKF